MASHAINRSRFAQRQIQHQRRLAPVTDHFDKVPPKLIWQQIQPMIIPHERRFLHQQVIQRVLREELNEGEGY
jgi:hypothetical protein